MKAIFPSSRHRMRETPSKASRLPSSIRSSKYQVTAVSSPRWKKPRISHRRTVPRLFHSSNQCRISPAPRYSGPQLSI